ncbi:MAG: serine protease, partial [Bacteroidota bacterium]
GSIGCFLTDKSGNNYALTAYHVVRGTRKKDYSDIGDKIESPPTSGELLGELCWYDRSNDIALINVDENVNIQRGSVCCFQLKEHIGASVLEGTPVKICSGVDDIKIRCGIVISTCCVVRENDDHPDCIFGTIQTTNLGLPGDSGSVVANMQNEAVGLLVKDKGDQCSYFMPLDILNAAINLRLSNTQFEFEKFY